MQQSRGRLPFDDNQFATTLTAGTITQGHAPPSSFADLIRVTKRGGLVIFTLRSDPGIDPAYGQALSDLVDQGRWTCCYEGPDFLTMPYGEPEVTHKCWVFEVN